MTRKDPTPPDDASPDPGATSRLPGFRQADVAGRRRLLGERLGLDDASFRLFDGGGDGAVTADRMIENAIGVLGLPLGVALNFVVDGADVLVPMCIEEPSVIAAASHAARLVRDGGGFSTTNTLPIMIAQVEVRGVADTDGATLALEQSAEALCVAVDAALPGLAARGGGARGVRARVLEPCAASSDTARGRLVVHLLLDCRDAMGANLCNSAAEAVAPRIAALVGGAVGLRILSNLSDERTTTVRARVPFASLDRGGHEPVAGADVAKGIEEASRFAELDHYRAVTHNKGIFNGIDAVALATGQDWRAVEAGGHAYAALARPGSRYSPLSRWRLDEGAAALHGEMTLPLALGTVGGAVRVHEGVRLALRIAGSPGAQRLASIAAAAGLATNLAALRALATEGIQRGHMALHHRYRDPPGSS